MNYACNRSMAALLVAFLVTTDIFSAEPVEIGKRLELFVDDHLIANVDGDVSQRQHVLS
jgi:hypothetical protein